MTALVTVLTLYTSPINMGLKIYCKTCVRFAYKWQGVMRGAGVALTCNILYIYDCILSRHRYIKHLPLLAKDLKLTCTHYSCNEVWTLYKWICEDVLQLLEAKGTIYETASDSQWRMDQGCWDKIRNDYVRELAPVVEADSAGTAI